jgi:uncharacterized protein involved in exopolysaccharide biosynthesis
MHDHDHDHGIRARAARIRAAHDREATRLEEKRRRAAELEAECSARFAFLARLRVNLERLERRAMPCSHPCAREDASPS